MIPNPNVFGGALLVRMNTLVNETSEIPSGGALTTGADMFRFAEMLRRGGQLDGACILSPATIRLATSNHTGERPNNLMVMTRELEGMDEYPAYLGLGFILRGHGISSDPTRNALIARDIRSSRYWIDGFLGRPRARSQLCVPYLGVTWPV